MRRIVSQVHTYAAVSSEGASDLYFATGTTGLNLGYRKAKPTKREKEMAAALGQDALPAIASGVGSEEYRDILGGTGAHATQPGLLKEMAAIFDGVGRAWTWQQDGARAHTICRTTKLGKATRQLILTHANDLIDDWPALSADLTPIENFWALTEHRLWSAYTWHNLDSFKIALRKAWKDVTSDKNVLKSVCGSFEKRRVSCIAEGGKKINY